MSRLRWPLLLVLLPSPEATPCGLGGFVDIAGGYAYADLDAIAVFCCRSEVMK